MAGLKYTNGEPLYQCCHNVLAYRLGEVAVDVRKDRCPRGDNVDDGLILLRLLHEKGFNVSEIIDD